PSPTPPSASDIAAAPDAEPSPTPLSANDIAAASDAEPSPTPPSAGDIAAASDAQPLPSQTSTDSADHRAAYVLGGTATVAALAIVAAGMWAVRRRRRTR
ncbi:MAG: hypothetical protein M3P30_12400, partial [Chloroflexota bacterium]|nr:hypothetical protein [Chloroflexota bacterium]